MSEQKNSIPQASVAKEFFDFTVAGVNKALSNEKVRKALMTIISADSAGLIVAANLQREGLTMRELVSAQVPIPKDFVADFMINTIDLIPASIKESIGIGGLLLSWAGGHDLPGGVSRGRLLIANLQMLFNKDSEYKDLYK